MFKNTYSNEEINSFLTGKDPQQGIVAVECGYKDNEVSVIYRNPETMQRFLKKEPFKPFMWAKAEAAQQLFKGDKNKLKFMMSKMGIGVKGLNIFGENGFTTDRLRNGFKVLFFATTPMSNEEFQKFFRIGGVNLYQNRGFMTFTPVEQYLISTGKRLFKGFEDYDNLVRLQFDLETQGLNPSNHAIDQIGVSTNKGFIEIIRVTGEIGSEERLISEGNAIKRFIELISILKPDVIAGHNSFNFDWDFLRVRTEVIFDTTLADLSLTFLKNPIISPEKPSVLKLGGETEYFKSTQLWGHNIVDGMHAVRRAMAIDSNIKSAALKYITKKSKLNKPNRVYVDGKQINAVWSVKEPIYGLNDTNGQWYKITPNKPLNEGDMLVTGEYIVERYLADDLYETDKVELTYNQSNFLLSKMIPTTFSRACTMGTASIWKLILAAWSYDRGLAIPDIADQRRFTGGLSRLLKVGYVDNVVKLDYNSLYPAIMLTFGISPDSDISGVMLQLLGFILSERERFKGLMGKAKKQAASLEVEREKLIKNSPEYIEMTNKIQEFQAEMNAYDKKQLPFKIFGNSFFGSFGAQYIFNWGETDAAEEVTCTGRQALRLMIKWFSERGFTPIVGDSFLYDTPLYVKHKTTGIVDIMPMSDLLNVNEIKIDGLGREYDYSPKDYYVLCRRGWCNVEYIYRHKTDKKIHRIKTKTSCVDVTADHSLFDYNKQKIHSKDCTNGTRLEMYDENIGFESINDKNITLDKAWLMGFFLADGDSNHNEWSISKLDISKLEKAQEILEKEYNVVAKIHDYVKSSGVYKLQTEKDDLCVMFSEDFYTKKREKKIPHYILNNTEEIKKSFLDGFYYGDGDNTHDNDFSSTFSFSQKSKTCVAGLFNLIKSIKNEYTSDYHLREHDVICENNVIENYDEESYVYDISLDGTVVNALGNNVLAQTDGFNFQYKNEECPYTYIGKGLNRNTKEGVEYVGVEAYVAEFNDLFMRNKMGLGIDEYAEATINFARKNYADLLVDHKTGERKVKLVGNSIKSKKMPLYIEKFINEGVYSLLTNQGKKFLDDYYDYIDRIYNLQIPLIEIASKGRVKISISEYNDKMKGKTKNGNSPAKQAHMELIIKNDIKTDVGDTIYYINTGTKKSHGDVKVDPKTGEVKFNCVVIPREYVDEQETYIEEHGELEIEYNVAKYVEQFNKRVSPLLVCFSPDIRSKILAKTPNERKYFTEEECQLSSGHPIKAEHQDDFYENLMKMEDKEVEFWLRRNKVPAYIDVITGMEWDKIIEDYNNTQEQLKTEDIQNEVKRYNETINKFLDKQNAETTEEEKINKILTELMDFLDLDEKKNFISIKHNVKIGSFYDLLYN